VVKWMVAEDLALLQKQQQQQIQVLQEKGRK
jgi:hypothetical protein